MPNEVLPTGIDLALKRACPIYSRALAQAVDNGVELEDATMALAVFAIGALIGAVGAERAALHMGEIAAQIAVHSAGSDDAAEAEY